jgi:hypothetical protein
MYLTNNIPIKKMFKIKAKSLNKIVLYITYNYSSF